MNIQALNDAVQFAIDEHVRERLATPKDEGLNWEQRHWAAGDVQNETVEAKGYDEPLNVVCASGCCIAGAVVAGAGDKFVTESSVTPGIHISVENCVTKQGYYMPIDERAIELLGIDSPVVEAEDEEYDLFDGDNEIEDVIRIARLMAEEHGQVLSVDTQALDALNERAGA